MGISFLVLVTLLTSPIDLIYGSSTRKKSHLNKGLRKRIYLLKTAPNDEKKMTVTLLPIGAQKKKEFLIEFKDGKNKWDGQILKQYLPRK